MTPAALAELLERFAEEAATEEESTNARRAAAYLRTLPEAAFRAALRTVMIEGTKALLGVADLSTALRLGAGGTRSFHCPATCVGREAARLRRRAMRSRNEGEVGLPGGQARVRSRGR